jgi:ankyrin repeat protein
VTVQEEGHDKRNGDEQGKGNDACDRALRFLLITRSKILPAVYRPKKESMNSIDEELIEVAAENDLAEVSRLLSVGADANAKDNLGETPLHWASKNGHSQAVIELLEHGADVNAKDNVGIIPLHAASLKEHMQVFRALLDHGANVDAREIDGWTPLHNAASRDHLVIVKALVTVGADILAASNDGNLPIHLAVYTRNSAVAKFLLQQYYAATRHLPLHELMEDLTWIGNPDTSDVPQLHTARDWNVLGTDDVVEILDYLVGRNPAWPCSRDEDGSLPLHLACRRGASFSIVQSLVNHYQASVKSVTPQGDLPLFLACDIPEPSLDTVFLLMRFGLPMKSTESMLVE